MWLYKKEWKSDTCYMTGGRKIPLQDKFLIGYLDPYNNFQTVKITENEVAAIIIVNYLNGGDGQINMFVENALKDCLV